MRSKKVHKIIGDLTINKIMRDAYANSRAHGFHTKGRQSIFTMLGNIHSEVSEAWEEARNGKVYLYYSSHLHPTNGVSMKPEGVPAELADVIIRVCDTAEALGINLERAIIEKMAYNKTRPKRHGGKVI